MKWGANERSELHRTGILRFAMGGVGVAGLEGAIRSDHCSLCQPTKKPMAMLQER